MSRDYKHRLQHAHKQNQPPAVAPWQWLLAGGLVLCFVVFLVVLRSKTPTGPVPDSNFTPVTQPGSAAAAADGKKAAPPPAAEAAQPQAKDNPLRDAPAKPARPRFQFYTVLPEKEVIIPEAEVKARKQEEKQGKAPPLPSGEVFMLQIGSFKTLAEADRLKAQLAMLGVEAKIETAQIGTATWNRVKVGPFASMASADKIRGTLRQNNVDSVIQKALSPATVPAAVPPHP